MTAPDDARSAVDGPAVGLDVIADDCQVRQMILDRSRWLPPGMRHCAAAGDRIVRTAGTAKTPLTCPLAGQPATGRRSAAAKRRASRDKQDLPDTWNPATGENILWRTPIPGPRALEPDRLGRHDLRHERDQQPRQRDVQARPLRRRRRIRRSIARSAGCSTRSTSAPARSAGSASRREGEPRNKRHIKSTYASALARHRRPHRRRVVRIAGHLRLRLRRRPALVGRSRPRRHGRLRHSGATSGGPASSPIIWNGLVIVQCDTQADSFLLALNAETGETVWKTRSPGAAVVGHADDRRRPPPGRSSSPTRRTSCAATIRRPARELWKLGGSSKLTAPTPIFADGLHIIASGRAPERPMFAVRAGARGDLTLAKDATENAAGRRGARPAADRTCRRRSPIAGIVYVLANNGVFDAYEPATGKEIYRQRLPLVGSGYSASPVAADGKIYLSNEDGEMLVVEAGATFKHIATNSIGEMLMATPALSDGVMFVRGRFDALRDRTRVEPECEREQLLARRSRSSATLPSTVSNTGTAFSMSSILPSEMRAQVFSIGGKSRPTATPSCAAAVAELRRRAGRCSRR